MIWLSVEVLIALIVAVLIVWFTFGGRHKPPPEPRDQGEKR